MIALTLPFPPSTNNLFLNGRNKARIKTPRYRAWEAEALVAVRQQLPRINAITGEYNMLLKVKMPRRGRIDVANFEKATSDLLVTAGVISDDCNARICPCCGDPLPRQAFFPGVDREGLFDGELLDDLRARI